jgi:integrase
MFLFKRSEYYHLEYFDETENRIKRISTKCKNKGAALKFLTDFKNNLKQKPKVKFITLKDFEAEYLEYIKLNFSNHYLTTVEVSFRLLQTNIGDIPLSKISVYQLEKFFTETFNRTKEGARTYLIALKSAFNKAIKWSYLSENPFTKIKLPSIPQNSPLFIDEIKLNKILEKVNNAMLNDLYIFAYHTGARLGEIINLKWNQVSLAERLIKITNTDEFTTKGKKERVIPMNEKLFKLLKNRIPKYYNLQDSEYVFNKDGIKLNSDYVSKKFKKAIRETKSINPKFHFHDLRHSFASNLAKNGVSLFIIKELLGHQDIRTTQIYAHLTVDSLRNAVKVLEG